MAKVQVTVTIRDENHKLIFECEQKTRNILSAPKYLEQVAHSLLEVVAYGPTRFGVSCDAPVSEHTEKVDFLSGTGKVPTLPLV